MREHKAEFAIMCIIFALLGLGIYSQIQHSRKIDALMAECMKDKKEYECYALIKAPDEQRQAINNAAMAAGVAAGAVAGGRK